MINKVTLIGRAGKDPELHHTESGKNVTRFSLATWMNIKDEKESSGWRQVTEWHNIVIWGDSAVSIAKNLKKGDLAYVEGSVHQRTYEKDGSTRYITEIVGTARVLGAEKKDRTAAASTEKREAVSADTGKGNQKSDEIPPENDELSDLPF